MKQFNLTIQTVITGILIFIILLCHSSCAMFSNTFKRLNFQFEDSTLNYIQTKTIGDFKLQAKQIDLFDRSFLALIKTEIKRSKYAISSQNNTNIFYRLTKPAIEFKVFQNETELKKGVYQIKVSLGGILEGQHKQFILIEDSISSGFIELNQTLKEEIPAWAKEKPENCILFNNKYYYLVLEENQIFNLARNLGMKTIQTIEKQFQKDLNQNTSK